MSSIPINQNTFGAAIGQIFAFDLSNVAQHLNQRHNTPGNKAHVLIFNVGDYGVQIDFVESGEQAFIPNGAGTYIIHELDAAEVHINATILYSALTFAKVDFIIIVYYPPGEPVNIGNTVQQSGYTPKPPL